MYRAQSKGFACQVAAVHQVPEFYDTSVFGVKIMITNMVIFSLSLFAFLFLSCALNYHTNTSFGNKNHNINCIILQYLFLVSFKKKKKVKCLKPPSIFLTCLINAMSTTSSFHTHE